MKMILYLTLLAAIVCGVFGDDDGLMIPHERNTIDDCKIRYYADISVGFSAPSLGHISMRLEHTHAAAIGWLNEKGKIEFGCGGSLILESFVLTAAHCMDNPNTLERPLVVRLGDRNLIHSKDSEYAQEIKIRDIIPHPKYNRATSHFDIAILVLQEPARTIFGVIPACLWLEDELPISTLYAAGWGASGFNKKPTNYLVTAVLQPVTNEECIDKLKRQVPRMKLANGISDHQLCAAGIEMDTCKGDSGGPLYSKLNYANRLVPFLVGVTSYGGPCGFSQPGVYVRVSKFRDWIIETIRQFNPSVTASTFDPMSCAKRNLFLREADVLTLFQEREPNSVQLLYPQQPSRVNCGGILAEPDAVITLATCVKLNGAEPSHVKLFGSEVIDVEKTVYHPKFGGNLQNNIAIIKLKRFSNFRPHCIEYDTLEDIALELPVIIPTPLNIIKERTPFTYEPARLDAKLYENLKCSNFKQSFGASPQGLQSEMFCFGNDESVAPGACHLVLGGPIYTSLSKFPYGLNLHGRDCGFGKPAMGLLLKSYKSWFESVFLPRKGQGGTGLTAASVSSAAAVSSFYHNPNQGDQCVFNGVKGVCVPVGSCSTQTITIQNSFLLCKSSSYVCCPNQLQASSVLQQPTEIDLELNECKTRYQRLRMELQNRWLNDGRKLQYSHTAAIGFQYATEFKPVCPGYLISTRGVVTAASCLGKLSIDQMMVRLGWHGERSDPTTIRFEPVLSRNVHPLYNETTGAHNIAVIKLKKAIQPNVHLFPACLWSNSLESPVRQRILSDEFERFELIHPLYKTDCEKRLNCPPLPQEIVCMRIADEKCRPSSISREYACNDRLKLKLNKNCYQGGNPIVWRKEDHTGLTEYLLGVYSIGDCKSEVSLHIVQRVAFYIDWFAKVML
uniref:Peptidase S1 domain-containing protein n=1 Tax=Anopheles quadriannulatus TaxID=34691 RepID=A0A182WUH7_ANOQN